MQGYLQDVVLRLKEINLFGIVLMLLGAAAVIFAKQLSCLIKRGEAERNVLLLRSGGLLLVIAGTLMVLLSGK